MLLQGLEGKQYKEYSPTKFQFFEFLLIVQLGNFWHELKLTVHWEPHPDCFQMQNFRSFQRIHFHPWEYYFQEYYGTSKYFRLQPKLKKKDSGQLLISSNTFIYNRYCIVLQNHCWDQLESYYGFDLVQDIFPPYDFCGGKKYSHKNDGGGKNVWDQKQS